jgi:hypothetical protein
MLVCITIHKKRLRGGAVLWDNENYLLNYKRKVENQIVEPTLDKKIPIKYFFIALYSLPVIFFLITVYVFYAFSVDIGLNFHLMSLFIPFLILAVAEFVLWVIIKISQKSQLSKKTFLSILSILLLLPVLVRYSSYVIKKWDIESFLIAFLITSGLFTAQYIVSKNKTSNIPKTPLQIFFYGGSFIFWLLLITLTIQYYFV